MIETQLVESNIVQRDLEIKLRKMIVIITMIIGEKVVATMIIAVVNITKVVVIIMITKGMTMITTTNNLTEITWTDIKEWQSMDLMIMMPDTLMTTLSSQGKTRELTTAEERTAMLMTTMTLRISKMMMSITIVNGDTQEMGHIVATSSMSMVMVFTKEEIIFHQRNQP